MVEVVGVDDDGGLWFGILELRLERSRVHCYKHIALVARREHLLTSDVYLKAAYPRERPLRCPDVGRIVRKCGNAIAHGCRHGGEDVARQLHTVARVAREAHDYLVQFFYFNLFCHNVPCIRVLFS